MITESQARIIATQYLEILESDIGDLLTIIDKETIEKSFGWIFFYNSKKYLYPIDPLFFVIPAKNKQLFY